MLLGNYSVLHKSPLQFYAGSTTSVEPQLRSNFNKSGRNRNGFYVDQATTALKLYAVPSGYYPPYTWLIPQGAGGIGSTQQIFGIGATSSPNLAGGWNLLSIAGYGGSGDITSAVGSLIVSAVASLTGSGTIATADLLAFLNAVATVTGSGDITTAALAALAWFNAALSSSGDITSATPYATGTLAADILSYTSLTSEGVRDKVWQALATEFNESGTMGQKLNAAGTAGDPWTTTLPGGYTGDQAGNIIGTNIDKPTSEVPGAVWEEPVASHTTPGTYGLIISKIKAWVGWLRSLL